MKQEDIQCWTFVSERFVKSSQEQLRLNNHVTVKEGASGYYSHWKVNMKAKEIPRTPRMSITIAELLN
jgi:hypothetical protein